MLYLKRESKQLFITLLFCLVLAGCGIFDDAKHALKYFCPGLNIGVNGVHVHTGKNPSFAIKSYMINYPDKDESQVEKYFQEANGYSRINNMDVSSINSELVTYVDQSDNLVGKSFKSGRDSAIVAFNRTKQEIIIIEYLTNPRVKR